LGNGSTAYTFAPPVNTVAPTPTAFNGLIRPSISSFTQSDNSLKTTNSLGYFCVTSAQAQLLTTANTLYLTNYITAFSNFVLDFYPDNTFNWATAASLAPDRTNEKYNNDVAGNLKITFGPPAAIPTGANILIGSSNFNAATYCGVVISGQVATQCAGGSPMTCPVLSGGTSFTLCCYNVSWNTDPITLSTLSITFPNDPNVTIANFQYYVNSSMYDYPTLSTVTLVTQNLTNPALADAQISNIYYSTLAYQIGAYGKVTFEVSLNREALRGMKVVILSNFTPLVITNITPRCYASFKNVQNGTFQDEDTLLDYCSVSNLASNIQITTKSIIYKCSIQISKFLYVSLWPINVYNFPGVATNTHQVTVTLIDSSGAGAKNSGTSYVFPQISPALSTTQPLFTQTDLCSVTSILPKIPGEPADYTFTIDLSTNASKLGATSIINEVTIFWPYNYYGSNLPNVYCTVGSVVAGCFFVDESNLTIRFTSGALPLNTKTNIVVYGVTNPNTTDDLYFVCTIGTYSNTVNRNVLAQGTTKYANGITVPSTAIKGNLKFLSVTTPLSSKNPRDTSTYTFEVAIDNAPNYTSLPFNSVTAPIVYIYFPQEYNLRLYNVQPSVTLEEWSWNPTLLQMGKSSIQPTVGQTTISGNRITATLISTITNYSFISTMKYWIVTISQIINPIAIGTTSPYRITITNTDGSMFLTTFTNLNNYWSDALSTQPTVLTPLLYNRGNVMVNDMSKWFIDINSVNQLVVQPGRYSLTNFLVQANSLQNPLPAATSVALSNEKTFLTTKLTYLISSSFYQAVPFYIGCPCDTYTGLYIVNFSTTDPGFAPMAPLRVSVAAQNQETITFSTIPASIPITGTMWVGYYFPDPNVDIINISWVPNTKNDATAQLSTVKVPQGTITGSLPYMSPVFSYFSITSTAAAGQIFTSADPGNNCYLLPSSITITTSSNIADATFNTSTLVNQIKYDNADDKTLTGFNKNAIQFTYTPPGTPSYVYCVLFCTNLTPPADSTIIYNNYSAAPVSTNTQLLQYYANYFPPATTTPSNVFVFNGLVRGMAYQLRCIAQGTIIGNSSSVISGTLSNNPNNATLPMYPSYPQATSCVQFNFNADPGLTTKNAMVNYCQAKFSLGGYWANGCIICTNADMSYNVPGLTLPNIVCSASSKKRLRFLQTASTAAAASTATPTVAATPVTYSVCAVPHPVCTTDVNLNNKLYADLILSLSTDLRSTANIATNLGVSGVNLNTTSIYSDSAVPNMAQLTGAVTNFAITGAVSWTATYATPLKCVWEIAATGSTFTYTNIAGCTDPSWCGTMVVGSTTATYSTSSTNLKAFTAGSAYDLHIACLNNIPGASLQSTEVKYTFTIPAPSTSTTNTTVCPNGTVLLPNGTCSSSFISLSLMMIMLIIAIFI